MKTFFPLLVLLVFLTGCDNTPTPGEVEDTRSADAAVSATEKPQEPTSPLRLDYGCDLYYLPVGDVYEQEIHPASFKVVNDSDIPQTITALEATCDCTYVKTKADNTVLQPGQALQVDFEVLAPAMSFKPFARFIMVRSLGNPPLRAQFAGKIKQVAEVTPERFVKLPMQKVPTQDWEVVYTLKASQELEKPLQLDAPKENKHLNFDFKNHGDGTYTLKVTPKLPLPYSRIFKQQIRIPVLEPAQADCILLELSVQIAEAVIFTPDKWTISHKALQESGSFTGRFAYGVVPGLQEEEAMSSKDMMNTRVLRQRNAVPLKFVREHHDWDDLFSNLQFRVPENVKLEKVRHPEGIEVKITITQESFAAGKTIQVVPFRGGNDCAPITISLVEE